MDGPHVYLRVHGPDGTGGLAWENANGDLFPAPDELSKSGHKPGDVFALRGDNLEPAAPDVWRSARQCGVVRFVSEHAVLVDVGMRMVAASDANDISPEVGNTVVLNVRDEIVGLASEEPIVERGVSLRGREEGLDPAQFEESPDPSLEWNHFGGFVDIIEQAREIVDIHLNRRSQFEQFHVRPLRGVLFEGPPGSGKTFLAKIMASKADAHLYVVGAAELGGQLVGESEGRLQDIYDAAGSRDGVSIVFVDEIDSITHHRGGDRANHADRLVSTFLVNMDGYHANNRVLTVGTTNRIEAVDTALRRPGRFDAEITFRAPSFNERQAILAAGAVRRDLRQDLPFALVAELSEGWTAAEVDDVWRHAVTFAVRADRSTVADDHLVMAAERIAERRVGRRALP